jgi:hypothetical protein
MLLKNLIKMTFANLVAISALICIQFQSSFQLQYVEIFRDDFTPQWSINANKWNLITAPSTVNNELQHYMWDDVWQGIYV